MKSLNKIKLDPTTSNIMQQYPTWCSNGPNMLDTTMLDDVGPTCCIRLNRPSRFPKVSQHPACMDDAIVHGKPFGHRVLTYRDVTPATKP